MILLDYVFSITHSLVQLHNEDDSFTVSTSLKNETSAFEEISFPVSTSLKNETSHDHSSFPVSSSLKNETNPLIIKTSLPFDLINEPSFHPTISNLLRWMKWSLGGIFSCRGHSTCALVGAFKTFLPIACNRPLKFGRKIRFRAPKYKW